MRPRHLELDEFFRNQPILAENFPFYQERVSAAYRRDVFELLPAGGKLNSAGEAGVGSAGVPSGQESSFANSSIRWKRGWSRDGFVFLLSRERWVDGFTHA